MKIKRSKMEICFNAANIILLVIASIVTLYPFWHVLVRSILPYSEAVKSDLYLFPTKIDLSAYKYVLESDKLLNSLYVSIFVVVVGTAYQLIITAMTAYGLTKKNLPGRNAFFVFIIITMFFSGGLIPYFLIIKNIGLIDNILVLILPTAISTYNVIVMKTFFNGLPIEMEESANIDGAGYFRVFIQIIMPLSGPVMATIGLFIAVGNWNNWFTPMIFLNNKKLWPLSLLLRDILINSNVDLKQRAVVQTSADYSLTESIKMAVVMVSIVPIIIIYPFVQKYFVKGVMIGSVKS